MQILPLSESHDRKAFDCQDEALNRWFVQIAMQHKAKGLSATFVAVETLDAAEVMGFYAVTMAEIRTESLPEAMRKRLPTRVPVARLGRLATSTNHRGKRAGEFLLFDAIDRVRRTARDVGGVGLVVDAKPAAVPFYQQYGFEQMLDHEQHLFLKL